ncbi:MAG: hypothetical protein Q4D80_04800, partial [Pseudomonadota bacterium]|nr:hypothetical protein [Pseudomonadota bacterium]
KFKTNKTISEYNYLIQGVLENTDYFDNIKAMGSEYLMVETISVLNLFPETWKIENERFVIDSKGNKISCFTRYNFFTIEIFLGNDNMKSKTEFCEAMMRDLACPLSSVFFRVWFYRGGMISSYYYGDKYCQTEDRQCLRNINLSDINTLCKSCLLEDKTKHCSLILEF